MHILQNFIFPNTDFNCPENLFIRKTNNAILIKKDHIVIENSSSLSTDTYYNAFSIGKWQDFTRIENLYLYIEITGKLQVSIYIIDENEKPSLLKQVLVSEKTYILIDTNKKYSLSSLLYIECIALEKTHIYAIDMTTSTEPNYVKLAIIITHYNRQEQLYRSLERIRQRLLVGNNGIEVFVIDNSSNTEIEPHDKIHVFANPNYGGSGGFARGMIESGNLGFTHCLLMDDDASCEIESIKRTRQLLAFNKKTNPAIVGALHQVTHPTTLIEKGATFNRLCQPCLAGHKVDSLQGVLQAEKDQSFNYGGWWFFAFSLKSIKAYPFPFFVRGDDIMFSLMNKFNLQTMNGINAFGDDFEGKNGPIAQYLDVRNHLVQISTITTGKLRDCIAILLRFYVKNLFTFNYQRIKAMNMAITDFLKGPQFFMEEIDMTARLPQLKTWQKIEKRNKGKHYDHAKSSIDKKLISILTLSGHLLPNHCLKSTVILKDKNNSISSCFGYKKIFFYTDPPELSFISEMNRKDATTCSSRLIVNMLLLTFKYRTIKIQYKQYLSHMTNTDFWKNAIKMDL